MDTKAPVWCPKCKDFVPYGHIAREHGPAWLQSYLKREREAIKKEKKVIN